MVKKVKRKIRKPAHGGDDSDYQRRKKEGTLSKQKHKKQKTIKIQRGKHKSDHRKCPNCRKKGE